MEDGRAVDEPAIGIAVKGADHGAGLRIDLGPALLSPDVEDHVAAAPVDHGAREARVAIERRHGLPSSAVGRSEERRVGKACVSKCRSRVQPYHTKKKNHQKRNNHADNTKTTHE